MNTNVTRLFLELMLVSEKYSSSDVMALRQSLLEKNLDEKTSSILDTVLLLKQLGNRSLHTSKQLSSEKPRSRENLSTMRASLIKMSEDRLNLFAFKLGIRKTASKEVILRDIERKLLRTSQAKRDEFLTQIRSHEKPDEGFMNLVDFLVNGPEEHSGP